MPHAPTGFATRPLVPAASAGGPSPPSIPPVGGLPAPQPASESAPPGPLAAGRDLLHKGYEFFADKLPTRVGQALAPGPAHLPLASRFVANHTQAAPPLTQFTHHLGGLKPTADAALGFLQRNLQDPRVFAGAAATLGAPLVQPLLRMPLGLAGVLGLHAGLAGGAPLGNAHAVFAPILDGLRRRPLAPAAAPPPRPVG